MSLRRERGAVSVILIATFLLFLTYSLVTPLFEASDELWHYPLVQHIATTGVLPVQRPDQNDATAPWRQEGSQPPLYYFVAALASSPFDSSDWRDLRRLNPHGDLGRPTTDGNQNAVIHTSAEQYPWNSAALAVHVARLISVIFSTLTVYSAYLVARELFPRIPAGFSVPSAAYEGTDDNSGLRLGVMIVTATVPMFAFISGSVNNDNAAALFATLGLWFALRLARRGTLSVTTALIAGVITACAALSKSSTLGLLGLFLLAAVLAGIRVRDDTPSGGKAKIIGAIVIFALVMFAATALLAGWWFIRNQQLYGDWLGWNAFFDAVGRRNPPASPLQLWSEREGFVWAYWGVFGTLNVVMPHAIYDILNGIVLAAIGGWIWAGIRPITHKNADSNSLPSHTPASAPLIPRWSPVLICAAWTMVTFVGLLRWTSLTPASQGRLMFPCIAVISSFIVYGLSRIHKLVLATVITGYVVLALVVPFVVIAPVYARPVALAQTQPEHPLQVTLGGVLDLIGYESLSDTVTPGATASLRLYWRSHGPLPHDYSVYVHLLNEDNVVVGQRDMYPGQGSIATSELEPAYSWSDRYDVIVSPFILTPQKLHWAVGLYNMTTGERLAVSTGASTQQGIEFGSIGLAASAKSTGILLDYGNGITLQSYEAIPRLLSAGGSFTVTLGWQAEVRIPEDFIVSLQLIDDKTNKLAQNDSAPVNGYAPTSTWTTGQHVEDTHVLNLAKDARPGVYKLLLVLYRPKDFSRLGAYGADGIYIGNEITLMQFRVR